MSSETTEPSPPAMQWGSWPTKRSKHRKGEPVRGKTTASYIQTYEAEKLQRRFFGPWSSPQEAEPVVKLANRYEYLSLAGDANDTGEGPDAEGSALEKSQEHSVSGKASSAKSKPESPMLGGRGTSNQDTMIPLSKPTPNTRTSRTWASLVKDKPKTPALAWTDQSQRKPALAAPEHHSSPRTQASGVTLTPVKMASASYGRKQTSTTPFSVDSKADFPSLRVGVTFAQNGHNSGASKGTELSATTHGRVTASLSSTREQRHEPQPQRQHATASSDKWRGRRGLEAET